MEHHEMDVDRWVDERLSSLDPPAGWRPDSSAALAQLRRRAAPPRHRWWLWATVSAAAAAAACAVVLLVTTPAACANPLGCSQTERPAPVRPAPVAVAAPAPAPGPVAAPANPPARDRQRSFKESGSPTAPVTCELYTDYECPHCAAFYLETVPQLAARYVETGKVRLIHRDFPLASHRYARLAARYANAAGQAGYYQAVVSRLFRTQAVWSADGDVDGQVARAVPAAAMEKVRTMVRDDPTVENAVAADEGRARENGIARTPTLLCNGQIVGPNLSLSQVEASLDPLLAQR
jgi:protein-disulfide isomerase